MVASSERTAEQRPSRAAGGPHVDRSRRLLDELKIAEARSVPNSWGERDRHVRREVRELRAAWEAEQTRRSARTTSDDLGDDAGDD